MRRWFRSRDVQKGAAAHDPPPRRTRDWRTYDLVADAYARTLAPQTRPVAADVLAMAETRPGSRVLDVGTGTGEAVAVAREIVGAEGSAVGIDIAPAMLSASRDRTLALAAAETINLPFGDSVFDVVSANFVLTLVAKLDTALYDMTRVLKSGGVLAVANWEAGSDELSSTWRSLVEEAVGHEVLRGTLKELKPWAALVTDRAKLETVLRDAGLRPVRVEVKKYRFEMSREDYIDAQSTTVEGRFVRGMLGDAMWERFRTRASERFAQSFGENVVDFRDVLLATGTLP